MSAAKLATKPTLKIGVLYSPTSKDTHETEYSTMFANDTASKLRYKGKTLAQTLNCEFPFLDFNVIVADVLETIQTNDPYFRQALKKRIERKIDEKGLAGIILPGNWYNVIPKGKNDTNPNRELVETLLVEIAEERKMPLLGICGGLQRAAFDAIKKQKLANNSKLTDAELEKSGNIMTNNTNGDTGTIHCDAKPDLTKMAHGVKILAGTDSILRYCYIAALKKLEILQKDTGTEVEIPVNSEHNQAIIYNEENVKALKAAGYKVIAVDDPAPGKIQIIEAIEHEDGHIILTQFHPEYFALGAAYFEAKGEEKDGLGHRIGAETMGQLINNFREKCEKYEASIGDRNKTSTPFVASVTAPAAAVGIRVR